MPIQLPEDVKSILHILQDAGYEAYAVGGCIRDSLLGRTPDDWDITTSARPEETKALFEKTIDTGIQHGTVTVMRHGRGYEVTTYRVDGEYEDGRHPKEVTFTASLEEDLKRRDFTVNAMAYNEEDGLVDLFGGRQDLERKIIRCVGEANERFEEDALRIMRAVRFSAQLGFTIEERTKEAIRGHADRLRQVSAERIQMELTKLVTSPNPDFLRIAWETGITAVVLPEFDRLMEQPQNNPHHCFSVGEHTLHAMRAVRPDKCLRLAMLLHDVAKPLCLTTDEAGIDHFHGHAQKGERIAAQILKRLRYDNHTTELVSRLVKWHDAAIEPEKKAVRRAASRMGKDLFPLILEVKAADLAAQSDYRRAEKQEWLEQLRGLYEEIEREGDCLTIKDLAVNGRDLMRAGMEPGPQLGRTLQGLLEIVLEDPEKNTKEYLLSLLPKET
ncbi:MAG TPA: CCA tRNA nucleotidyltransferase [Candidatus Eisenbergiella stercoravium]|nr:CCA tRNA nucleotidyltransferase [Candidatus Eisenbergiella stercoravium]